METLRIHIVLIFFCAGLWAQAMYNTIGTNGNQSDFPQAGFFVYSYAFPEGTELTLRNPATNARVQVSVLSPLRSIGGTMLLSPQAASSLGVFTPTLVQVEQSDASSIAALEKALSRNPDINPALSFRDSLSAQDQTEPNRAIASKEDPINDEPGIAELPGEESIRSYDITNEGLQIPDSVQDGTPEFDLQTKAGEERIEEAISAPSPQQNPVVAEGPAFAEEPISAVFAEKTPDEAPILPNIPGGQQVVPQLQQDPVPEETKETIPQVLPTKTPDEAPILPNIPDGQQVTPQLQQDPVPEETKETIPQVLPTETPDETPILPTIEDTGLASTPGEVEILTDLAKPEQTEKKPVLSEHFHPEHTEDVSASLVQDNADYIQVGAFKDPVFAQELHAQLGNAYETAVIQRNNMQLVLVGPILEDEKGILLYTLQKTGHPDAFVRNASEFQ